MATEEQSVGATHDQHLASGFVDAFKLKYVEPTDGRIGGDQLYDITDETIATLKAAMEAKKYVVVCSDGSVRFE